MEIYNMEFNYKSPLRKLAKYFKESRDKWKKRSLKASADIIRYKNRIKFLESSKSKVIAKNKILKEKIDAFERESLKKKLNYSHLDESRQLQKNEKNLPSHRYTASTILGWILLVSKASSSLRSASRVMKIFRDNFSLPLGDFGAPSWYTGRLWLMRLGYYKLHSEKEKANDWIWIIDHSVQIGKEKCLVILGIRLCNLPKDRALRYEDVEPIEMIPVSESNGDIVYNQLELTKNKTGVPRSIVADYGSDVKSGIEKFCDAHEVACYIYDVKHKMASLLKRELTKDSQWESFISLASKSKQQVQQTELAGLAPPNQRSKARYMNTEYLLDWSTNMLKLLQESDATIKLKEFDAIKMREKLGWISDFKNDIGRWNAILEIATVTENFIRRDGIYNNAEVDLLKKLDKLKLKSNPTTDKFKEDVLGYVKGEAVKAHPHEQLLGSSEIIESLFGKQKFIEKEQSKSGFTGLLLTLPALVSKTTDEVIRKAMESTPVKNIYDWYKENIKSSLQLKRKKAFDFSIAEEQNLDQISGVT